MAEQGFTLNSPDFVSDGNISSAYTCDGDNISPGLKWTHPPAGTRSFALIVDDPDAPKGTFTHWVLFDVSPDGNGLPRDASSVGTAGRNDFQQDGYGGPCPPPNDGDHRYYFKLFALDNDSLNLESGAKREQVEQAMEGHVLGEATLMGRYRRTTG